ncbi:MAG: hypothetical protein R8J85_06805 [Mariprofundales bacterium]
MKQCALITGGLIQGDGKWLLHPELMAWQSALLRRKQQWFDASLHNPLSLLAALIGVPAARLLADGGNAAQYWVVTPWHGQAVRDRVRLLPEAMLEWCQHDADWLKGELQPLLDALMMELVVKQGGAMVMQCQHPLDAAPVAYPVLAENGLTNRHPNGGDGGKLMRLLAEIQMALHQQEAPQRNNKGAIHGVWLWGGWQPDLDDAPMTMPHIACRDPLLQPICDGRDPQWLIGSVEEMVQMLPDDGELPQSVVLTGSNRAILLAGHRWFPFGKKRLHEADHLREASALWSSLRSKV